MRGLSVGVQRVELNELEPLEMGVDEYVLPLVGQVSEHLAIQAVGSMFRIPANHCGNGVNRLLSSTKDMGFVSPTIRMDRLVARST